MNFERVYAIFLRQLFLMRGSSIRFINIFTWIFVDVLLWGFITKYLNEIGGSFDFVSVFLSAIVLWGFLSQVQRGFILASLEDVWTRNYMNLFASPLHVREYLVGLVLSSAATTLAGMLFILFVAAFVFGFNLFILGLFLIPFIAILFLFGIALGVFATAIVLRVGPAGEWLAWPIPALISPFVGVFYPIAVLPEWMQAVARFLPPTYVFEGMRSVIFTGRFDAEGLYAGIALSVASVALAYGAFIYVYRVARERGLISRFSAESG